MASGSFPQEAKKPDQGKTPAAGEAKGKIQEAASSVVQRAQDVAASVAHKAEEASSAVVDKTDGVIAAAGQQLTALAGTVRDAAPREGMIGSAATSLADNLQSGGRYLADHGLQEMGKDVAAVIRHHPMQSVLVGFGLGCLLGMTWGRRHNHAGQ